MDILLLYFFVYSLALVKSLNVRQTTRQDGPVSSYIGAVKTAKLINIIKQMRERERRLPMRSGNNHETKDAEEPNIMESMKLLQKNYDTSRKYNKDNMDRHVNIQYISNPEVLDIYRKQPARRREDSDISLYRQLAYGEEVKRNSRLSIHMLNNSDSLIDYMRYRKALLTSSSTEKDDKDSISDDDDDSKDDEPRRNIVHFHIDEDLEATDDTNSEDVPDVTLKPEEAFDIVKPFIVEIFNKLKEKAASENEKDAKSDKDDFYDPKKITSLDEDNEKVLKLKINDATTEMAIELKTHKKELQDTDKDNQANENILKDARDKQSFRHLTTPDEIDVKDSWRKKEKEKYNHRYENMSHEKRNRDSRENRGRNTRDDNDWEEKKLPASKKSFVEPPPSNGWDDKGYGYWKKTNWDRKGEKNSGSEEKHNNKDNFDETDIYSKKHSKDNKNEVPNKDSKTFSDKDNSGDRNKKGRSKYLKNYDDDRDNKESEKNDWDKPANKKDDWDKLGNKKYDWDRPLNKKDDWDKPKSDKDDWYKPNRDKDDWDKPNKKKDDWDTPKHKKNLDWDKDEDRSNKKADNWNKEKDDDWNDKDTKPHKNLPDNQNRDKGWDLVGLDNNKRNGEEPYAKQLFGDKKKSLYSERGNYEIFKNAKGDSHEKDSFKDDYKPKKKNDWDKVIPKFADNYDRPKKIYNSHEKRPSNSAFGRTSIPVVGKKAIYTD